MSTPLTSSADLKMRKDLVRLRLEMHRQQLRYHARPLASPLHYAQRLFGRHKPADDAQGSGKSPALTIATVVLFLFGRRLGRVGKWARIGITLYPCSKASARFGESSIHRDFHRFTSRRRSAPRHIGAARRKNTWSVLALPHRRSEWRDSLDWNTLLTRERLGKPTQGTDELGRSPFHKDHDRIIFSGAFRRLGRKTQVHPVSSNDHIHTRLTHSLEVSCVGRSLGMRVGEVLRDALPEWCSPADLGMIVQSACLAHDIGNPPFGHSGEDAIRYWFQQAAARGWLDDMSDAERSDFLNFEGNAQGFRVLTQLEYHQFDGGMRLTYATLGAYLKYPWTSRHAEALGYKKHKFGCYQNEQQLLEQITTKLGLPCIDNQRWARHPLVYLMEAADDICYGLIDLEDGLEMELLDYAEVEALLLDLVGDDLPETYRQLGPAIQGDASSPYCVARPSNT